MNKWTRRAFIGTGGLLGVGLVVGVGGYTFAKRKVREYSGEGMGEGNSLNAFIRISPDNNVTLALGRAEMGQGVYTSLAQLVAEELEVDMSRIKVIHPQAESPYANTFLLTHNEPNIFKTYTSQELLYAFLPIIATGGSTTIPDAWNNMRYAGATAREMLKAAAAKKWDINISECKAESGEIINTKTKERIEYGALAEMASSVELKALPELKKRIDYKLIGKPVQRLDIPEKVTGDAEFGMDVKLDNMLYASIKHPSTILGKITSIDNEEEILKLKGVKKIILTSSGQAAVIADNTWRASMAARQLEVTEDQANTDITSENLRKMVDAEFDNDPIKVKVTEGDVEKAMNDSNVNGNIIEARYDVPYLAHATMEPMNCTVRVDEDSAECWVGHQATSVVKDLVSKHTGISKDKVKTNITYLGGGFGRRGEPDFVQIACEVAKSMPGTPIKTVFTREEDMKNDMYRPMAAARFKAKLSESGDIIAFDNKLVLQSVNNNAMMRIMPSMATKPKDDEATAEGIADLPYKMENLRVSFGNLELPIQIGFWRSVGYSQNSFFAESFIDECAHASNMDPYQFRKSKLADHPRYAAVLDKLVEISEWSKDTEENRFKGMALVKSFGSIVGEVAEIIKIDDTTFKIDKYHCVIDCGNIVNPDTIKAQMEGGIVFGLTAALHGKISWNNGAVDQSNFHDYEMVKLKVAPSINVHIMDVDEYPGGVGEPGTPPAAPALANAIFAATGKRFRSLPLSDHGLKFV